MIFNISLSLYCNRQVTIQVSSKQRHLGVQLQLRRCFGSVNVPTACMPSNAYQFTWTTRLGCRLANRRWVFHLLSQLDVVACLHPNIQDAHKASCTHVNDPGCFAENESSRLQVLILCHTDFHVKGYILISEKICKASILIHLPGVGVGERSSNFCWNLRKDSCTVTGTMQNNYLWSGTQVILNIANASIFRFSFWWLFVFASMLQASEVVSNAGQPSRIPSQRVLWDNATAGLGPYGCAPSGFVGRVWTQLGVSMMKNHSHLERKISLGNIRWNGIWNMPDCRNNISKYIQMRRCAHWM